MFVSANMYGRMHVTVYVWSSEGNLRCPSHLLPCLRQGLSVLHCVYTRLGVHEFPEILLPLFPISPLACWDYRCVLHLALCRSGESKF